MTNTELKPVTCKNCNKIMFYAHVFVGEVKHKCGYKADYEVLTESFLAKVRKS